MKAVIYVVVCVVPALLKSEILRYVYRRSELSPVGGEGAWPTA